MELLDLRDELRDIWLWLGEEEWVLDRSHVETPLVEAAAAAEAEVPAAPKAVAVPGWVTITVGWTEAPILPVESGRKKEKNKNHALWAFHHDIYYCEFN